MPERTTTPDRPCERCTPGEPSRQERVVRACRRLEGEEPEPTLDALAAEAGRSRAHFQRTFKRVVGLTPKQDARTRRGERFRTGLANGLAAAIPCHRVVRADGQLSDYRWGVDRKRALLERERAPGIDAPRDVAAGEESP